MSGLGVTVAVIEQGQILLIQREDFKVWALPGGKVEQGESVAQAGIREVREETGIEVILTRLVGIYARPNWIGDTHAALFAAQPVGGILQAQPEEVDALMYTDPQDLPEPFIWWHRQLVLDAINGVGGGVVWSQDVVFPLSGMTQQEVYKHHSRGDLPLSDVQAYLSRKPAPTDQILEVGD